MSTVLLKTKLYIPAARPGLVPRPHLIARLNDGLNLRLIFIGSARLRQNHVGEQLGDGLWAAGSLGFAG